MTSLPRYCFSVLLAAAVLVPAGRRDAPQLAAQAQAVAPRDEVLRLVPEDVGFCLLIQDLRGQSAAFADSPFADQFQKSLLGRAVRSAPELAKLAEMEKQFKEAVGVDGVQLRDEILGDAVALAYRPGPPGKPEQEEGLFVVRARNAQLLATIIERLNAVQKKAGDLLKLEERAHNGVKYYQRVERRQAYYYWQRGPFLAASGQESMLKRVIDLDKQAPPAQTKTPPISRSLTQLGADKGFLSLWLNPRVFDADLEERAKAAKESDATALKAFHANWQALEGVALFVVPSQQLEVSLAVRAKPEGLTPGVRKFFTEAAKPSALWNAFPDNALLAVAGRVDSLALIEMVGDFLPDEARQTLRRAIEQGDLPAPAGKLVKDLVPNLGPDVGFCIMAPDAQDKAWLPHGFWALRVQPGKTDPPADQTLWQAVNFAANLAVLDYNSKHTERLTLRTAFQDKVEVKYFVNDKQFPPGVQPAFALKDGYLVAANTPETVRRFTVAAAKAPASDEVPLLRMSLAALRGYIKERREPLLDHLAEKNHIPRDEAVRRLESLRMGLQFLDRVELTQRSSPGQVVLTLRIRTSQPLRK